MMMFTSKEFIFVALCVISRCLGDEEDNTSGGGGGSSSSGGGGSSSSSGGGSVSSGITASGPGWVTIGGGSGGGGVTFGSGSGGGSFMTFGSPATVSFGSGGSGSFMSSFGSAGSTGSFVSSFGSTGAAGSLASQGSFGSQCPPGQPPVICIPPPCLTNGYCQRFPQARCENYNCGTCRSRFFIGFLEVTSLCNNNGCPPGKPPVNCLVNPCQYARCPSYPFARCVPDYCGGCNARFYAFGVEVTGQCYRQSYNAGHYYSHFQRPFPRTQHVVHHHYHHKRYQHQHPKYFPKFG